MNKPAEQVEKETAAAYAWEKDQAGQLRASLLENPDDFFFDLLMEQKEQQ